LNFAIYGVSCNRVLVIGNAIFNVPRALININYGFAGGTEILHNGLFNAVRETSDHGPINTWDRLPFLTTQAGNGASFVPAINSVHHNMIMNNYACVWPIDHDDGSSFYHDHDNVLIYGGYKNYVGNDKEAHNQLYLYPDGTRYDMLLPDPHNNQGGGHGEGCCDFDSPAPREVYANNTCFLGFNPYIYYFSGCNTNNLLNQVPFTASNTFYLPPGNSSTFVCSVGGTNKNLGLSDFQKLGYDIGSTEQISPGIQTMIQMAHKWLNF